MLFSVVDKRLVDYSLEASDLISGREFLSRLPDTVIKNGDMHRIRQDITERLHDGGSLVPSNGAVTIATKASLNSNTTGLKSSVVQVRWIDGKGILIAKMFVTETVLELKAEIIAHFAGIILCA